MCAVVYSDAFPKGITLIFRFFAFGAPKEKLNYFYLIPDVSVQRFSTYYSKCFVQLDNVDVMLTSILGADSFFRRSEG